MNEYCPDDGAWQYVPEPTQVVALHVWAPEQLPDFPASFDQTSRMQFCGARICPVLPE
jgi:hypothetical protein